MYELIIYFVSLIIFFAVAFNVLKAVNIEGMFKKNKITEIKIAYIIISLVIAHILSEIVLKFYEWAFLILN
ncbi:MAG TPA: DUF1146 domain-containing protein [Acholeplasma sp.]|nr:DUF1146 domain-containing protein [Acholeplasma sp.]